MIGDSSRCFLMLNCETLHASTDPSLPLPSLRRSHNDIAVEFVMPVGLLTADFISMEHRSSIDSVEILLALLLCSSEKNTF